jgi:hypothetical protein
MSAATPFPIHEYHGRPHQMTPHVGRPLSIVVRDVENEAGVCVEHVRAGKPLTPKGAALLREFGRKAS